MNPVVREGNSDRRPAAAIKRFARKNPHKMMKPWPESGSKARVAHMTGRDYFENERSVTVEEPTEMRIEFVSRGGTVSVLKKGVPLQAGEVVDATVMNVAALRAFYADEIEAARKDGVLLSLHVKATMMKVSDPIMFGHCVSVYYAEALAKHAAALAEVKADVDNGLADILDKLGKLPAEKKAAFEADITAVYETRPALAMVDSRKGITNLHAPNLIIIDNSIPNMIRDGGRMWNAKGELQDCLAMVPDRCYATMYSVILEDAKRNGQFEPATMGNVANVGLMAQKAEEYGSHDKTFVAPGEGTIRVVDASGATLLERPVEPGDIFRACQVKDAPIQDWVKLAVTRARAAGSPAVFWLDERRAHDAEIIKKVKAYLPGSRHHRARHPHHEADDAMRFTLERVRRGEDTISVTGNVLRDYLTDLFPILELGTSARMLSIVPAHERRRAVRDRGRRLGSQARAAVPQGRPPEVGLPRRVLRARAVPRAGRRADQEREGDGPRQTLDQAIAPYLENERLPSRKVNEIDNRGSTFYLTLYWAQALAAQDEDAELKARFAPVARALEENEAKISKELLAAQGQPVDLGGYYLPDDERAAKAMRPSPTFNAIIDGMK